MRSEINSVRCLFSAGYNYAPQRLLDGSLCAKRSFTVPSNEYTEFPFPDST